MSSVPASRPDRKAVQPRGRLPLSASDAGEAIFGSFDGMTSTLGVVAGLLATRSSAPHVVAGAIGIAVRDDRNGRRPVPLRRPAQRAQGHGDGACDVDRIGAPGAALRLGSSTACVVASLAITLLAAAVIGHHRGYVVTYAILIVLSVLTIGLSIAVA